MRHAYQSLCAATLLALAGTASAGEIDVMTQNQYLGADIAPLIGAIGTDDFNEAVVTALEQIADNRSQQRFAALASLISKRQPHVVGLQEVWKFECVPALDLGGYPCNDPGIAGAFSDHLAGTLNALGPRYRLVAQVQNFSVQALGPYPGIYFTYNGVPAFLKVQDRDVIIVRNDVEAEPVALRCARKSEDGCNFNVDLPLGALGSVERGFMAIDTTIDGAPYRIFNTHLEVQGNDQIPGAIQTAQAAQLLDVALKDTPQNRRLILLGDMNSSPNDPAYGPLTPTPYMLFVASGLQDIWDLRPGATAGLSCCQAENLSNRVSMLNQRIDLVLSREMPRKVKDVRLLGEVAADRTKPPGRGLWPSDHASVAARIQY